jgi:selenocysteine lyase/cysteine desulfurase/LmbE family N-acetylglucosaminyl deacetylase
MTRRTLRLLGVFAHPDDETFCAGGTLARYAAEGADVRVLCASRGEAGQIRDAAAATRRTLGQVRSMELELACKHLGLLSPVVLDYPDGRLSDLDPSELRARCVREIREFRPHVLVTFDPLGSSGHPDHIAVSDAATQAFFSAGDPTQFPEQLSRGLPPHTPERLYYSLFQRSELLLLDELSHWLIELGSSFRAGDDFVHAMSFFASESTTLQYANDHVQVNWFPPGTYIVEQGEIGKSLYFILSGEVEVEVERPDGTRHAADRKGPGQFFGELALARHERRMANVIAIEGVTCLVLSTATPTAFDGRGPGGRSRAPKNGAVVGAPTQATTCVDVSQFTDAKLAAITAHRTQYPLRADMFPRSLLAKMLGREYFVRAHPPAEIESELYPAFTDPTSGTADGPAQFRAGAAADVLSRAVAEASDTFLRAYPTYATTSRLDDLRATEYSRLDEHDHVYLDYTGGGLYADSQIRGHADLLRSCVFGNPHSVNPTSQAMTDLDERARAYVLQYFNADPEEYVAIFTANASGALKLVGEAYPFQPGGLFHLLYDNHNSVVGLREFARARGARHTNIPVEPPELRLPSDQLIQYLEQPATGAKLFAYPAQSNFSGVQHPLEWIELAHERGWDVLVDCAAFVPTNRLDLGVWHPDFVPLSFYKMFGYPTGIGCLLARKTVLAKLRRPWFAGGTLWAASLQGDSHRMLEGVADAFEDGTVNYLGLPAVEIGLRHMQSIGIETIHERVMCLTGWLIDQLLSLRHTNGEPAIELYGPSTREGRGGTITFNFLDPTGERVDERVVASRLPAFRLSLRTGCFCNPGSSELVFRLREAQLKQSFSGHEEASYDQFLALIGMPTGGSVRVSLGLASNFRDVYRFMQFARTFLNEFPETSNLPPRPHC